MMVTSGGQKNFALKGNKQLRSWRYSKDERMIQAIMLRTTFRSRKPNLECMHG